MEVEVVCYIGVGLVCFGMFGVVIGVGNIFGFFFQGVMCNLFVVQQQFGNLIFGFVVIEVLGIFFLFIVLLVLFG